VNADDLQITECNCTTQTCGAEMLDTGAAVSAAQRPFAILQRTGTVASGATLSLDASTSFAADGRSLTSFEWSVQNLTGSAPVIIAPAQATTTLQITGTSQFTLRLTVIDDHGGQDIEEVALATPAAPPDPPPPAAPSRGGGGGGQFGWELLGIIFTVFRRRASRPIRMARASPGPSGHH
jgi:serine protease